MKIVNKNGKVFFGLHMVAGVAQYDQPDKESFRIFVNEDTIRQMGVSFAGCPVFVHHVDGVDESLDKVKNEADGWVVRSFYNAADGKNWVEFIIVTERGLKAIEQDKWRLSNAYIPQAFGPPGVWNGVSYQKEVTGGEYEHLAIVPNPRYEESIVMSPEDFKVYCEDKNVELKRLANSKEKEGDPKMSFKFFKREAVKNAADLEGLMVELPKSKKEITITQLINDHDAVLNMHGYANGEHMVKIGEKDEMSVNDLVKKHIAACNEMEEMKKAKNDGDESDDSDSAMENADDEDEKKKENADDEDEKKKENAEDEEKKDKMKNAAEKEAAAKAAKDEAKKKAAALKNANEQKFENELPTARIDLAEDQVARGKSRYGSL